MFLYQSMALHEVSILSFTSYLFFLTGFFLTDTGNSGNYWDRPFFFLSTTSASSWTFRHLFAALHVRWLPRICNRTTCNYQTTNLWHLLKWMFLFTQCFMHKRDLFCILYDIFFVLFDCVSSYVWNSFPCL